MFSGCCPIVGFFAHQVSHSGKLRIVLCEIIVKIEITLHTGEEGGFYDRKGGGVRSTAHVVPVLWQAYTIKEPLVLDSKEEVLTNAAAWMSLENIMPGARSQSQKTLPMNCPV